jgi:hypothetical protein
MQAAYGWHRGYPKYPSGLSTKITSPVLGSRATTEFPLASSASCVMARKVIEILTLVAGGTCTTRGPQSAQSSPSSQNENSAPGPPSEHAPSEALYGSSAQMFVHLSSVPGSTGTKRWPQSRQSSPNAHSENSAPGPPSEQEPSEPADGVRAHPFVQSILREGLLDWPMSRIKRSVVQLVLASLHVAVTYVKFAPAAAAIRACINCRYVAL